jgi:hypothetical protein
MVVSPEPAYSTDGGRQPQGAIKKVIEDALRAAGLMK